MRLDTVAPDVAVRLSTWAPDTCRLAAVTAAEVAVGAADLQEPASATLLQAIREGVYGDSVERSEAAALVEKLDLQQWSLQDRVDSGEDLHAEQLVAFRRARAAAAVLEASDPDPVVAADGAAYEALFAVEEAEDLWHSINGVAEES